ncbi:unnamed protein product [Lactuca saligna]|uniref:Uncharacterized protein n=1 Tax=Lactuca saligna TaxID=75948 RepID=A0AA35V7A6_LACSI|nr:unnamed protein product [Lactuca saligna]
MYASSIRLINLLRVINLRDDDPCPPCDCQDTISVERTAWTDDNVARRIWNCKKSLLVKVQNASFLCGKTKKWRRVTTKNNFQAMEANKQVFETQLTGLMKQNRLLKCGIFVMAIILIATWLKWP